MKITPLSFQSEGQQIIGFLHFPKKHKKAPLIILVHGWACNALGTDSAFFVKAARKFAEKGLAVLRFDFRGSGNSEGEFENQTISSMLVDLKNIIDQIKQNPDIDEKRIALIGHSQGGYLTILHASRDKTIKTIILWMGRTADLKSFWSQTTFDEIKLKGHAIWYDHKVANQKYVKDSFKYNSRKALRKISTPIGMIYGELDTIVPPSEGFRVKKFAKGRTEIKILSDLDHDFTGEKSKEKVTKITLEWLNKWMR